MAKYEKGTPASEEHRYADEDTCCAAAKDSYNGGKDGPEPPQIEWPDPTAKPPTTTIYSWRPPNTDVEMRFIVKPGLPKYPEIITYYRVVRVSKDDSKGDKDDLNEAISENELGAGSDQNQNERAKQDVTPVAPGKERIWRAIVRKKQNRLTDDPPTGLIINPPYPP